MKVQIQNLQKFIGGRQGHKTILTSAMELEKTPIELSQRYAHEYLF